MSSDKILRQRTRYSISRAQAVIKEQEASIAHLRVLEADLTARIGDGGAVEPANVAPVINDLTIGAA